MSRENYDLRLQNVSRVMGKNLILDDISWNIEKGEHWAMVGPNGAGKTTLMQIVTGYIWPTEGKVSVLGHEFGSVDLRELREDIGYVNSVLLERIPQEDTVLNVVVSGKFASIGLYKEPSGEDLQRAKELLTTMKCCDLSDRKLGEISQGEKQKVMIARSLMPDPGLLILDEPAIGLDPASRKEFLERISEIGEMKGGPTMIYITHHIEEIISTFGKVIVLKEGKVLAAGEREKVLTDETMRRAFEVDAKVIQSNGRYVLT